jgi:hypothetical protein
MYTIEKNTQQQVHKLLAWCEQQYSQFIYDCGIAYLTAYLPQESSEVITQILKTQSFWNWWKMRWEKRDEQFIEYCSVMRHGTATRLEAYKEIHDPLILAQGIHLNGVVLSESYSIMIGELNKEVLCQH